MTHATQDGIGVGPKGSDKGKTKCETNAATPIYSNSRSMGAVTGGFAVQGRDTWTNQESGSQLDGWKQRVRTDEIGVI